MGQSMPPRQARGQPLHPIHPHGFSVDEVRAYRPLRRARLDRIRQARRLHPAQRPRYLHLVYHSGVNLVRDVFRNGKPVVREGRLVELS